MPLTGQNFSQTFVKSTEISYVEIEAERRR
jgi:hypothetical protein